MPVRRLQRLLSSILQKGLEIWSVAGIAIEAGQRAGTFVRVRALRLGGLSHDEFKFMAKASPSRGKPRKTMQPSQTKARTLAALNHQPQLKAPAPSQDGVGIPNPFPIMMLPFAHLVRQQSALARSLLTGMAAAPKRSGKSR